MIRVLLTIFVLSVTSALAQAPGPAGAKLPPPPGVSQQPPAGDEVAPDDVVVTAHGICPSGTGNSDKPDSCTTVMTRRQFEAMLTVMNVTNQGFSPPALRSIAESYVQLMALAEEAHKTGLDKDPRFEEMMKVTRVRTMAEAYRRSLDEQFNNPSPDTLEAYYKQNITKYEQLKLDRVFIPLANPKRIQERAQFEKHARQLANDIRERAVKGEDMNALEAEAYKTLGLSSPPPTDLGGKRKGSFPPAVEADIFALKPGEVTKVETDLAGFSFYKLRVREPVPLEFVKAEITRELYQKSMEAAMKSVTSRVHTEFNEKYFKLRAAAPVPPAFRPAPHVKVVPPEPANTPVPGGAKPDTSPAPATSSTPPAQKPAPPK